MSKREVRIAKALALLRLRPQVTALEIGNAAVSGDSRARHIPRRGREAIGLSIGTDLVRRGQARITRTSTFAAIPDDARVARAFCQQCENESSSSVGDIQISSARHGRGAPLRTDGLHRHSQNFGDEMGLDS